MNPHANGATALPDIRKTDVQRWVCFYVNLILRSTKFVDVPGRYVVQVRAALKDELGIHTSYKRKGRKFYRLRRVGTIR